MTLTVAEPSSGKRAATLIGWAGIALFVAVYGVELLPHHGPPATVRFLRETFGQGGLIVLNLAIVTAFLLLLPYRRPTRSLWKSKGAFLAFAIALMTEMFGWPLLLFLLSPLVSVPPLAPRFFDAVGHWPPTAGTALSLAGLALVAAGWAKIHRAEGLVTTGVYRWVRHPQYAGILLFSLGWILHWPTVLTLLLWPVLAVAYVALALAEEREASAAFGPAWDAYAARTRRLVPFVV